MPFEYERTGTLHVAGSDAEAERLKAEAGGFESAGVAHEWLDGAALRSVAPSVVVQTSGDSSSRGT